MGGKFSLPTQDLKRLELAAAKNYATKRAFGTRLQTILQEVKPLILLIEDEDYMMRLYGRILKSKAMLMEANSAQTALNLAESFPPNLIISDGIGIPAIQELVRRGIHIPVVFSSGRSLEPNIPQKLGVQGIVVEKAAGMDTLLAAISKLIPLPRS